MRRAPRARTIRVQPVGTDPDGTIPPEAGIEVHSGIPGWTELEPGLWQNESGGTATGRYFAVTDINAWNTDLCFQLDSGEWICRGDAYTPPPPTQTTTGSQPEPPPIDVVVTPVTPVTPATPITPPAVITQTQSDQVEAPEPSRFPWWLVLIALYALTRENRK